MRYDALGRRIEKDVNGVITRFVYDNEDILFEVDGTGATQAISLHGPGIDEPLAVVRRFGLGFGTFIYHADGLGSITTLTDPSGTPVRSYTYDSFGRIVDETGTVIDPYTYTGREFDPETGLLYYRARYYDPTTGRFLQEDPIGLLPFGAGILNHLYGYVENNPINLRDPLGLISSCQALGAAKRAAAFGVCLTRAALSWRTEIGACFVFCSTAILTRGAIPALNVVCGICVAGAIVVGTIEGRQCLKEASAVPVDCPDESQCGANKPPKNPEPFSPLDIPVSLSL